MNIEDSPPHLENDKATTLGAHQLGAFDDGQHEARSDPTGPTATTASWAAAANAPQDESSMFPPPIDDVAGLEGLYTKTAEIKDLELPIAPGIGDAILDMPVPEPHPHVDSLGGRLPPPLEVDLDLKFSVENARFSEPSAAGYAPPIEFVEEPPRQMLPGRSVRSPGEIHRQSTIFDAVLDLTELRWFWFSVAVVATGLVGFGLAGTGLLSDLTTPADVPDIVADSTDRSDSNERRSSTTQAGVVESQPESSSSARFGNGGLRDDPDDDTTDITETPENVATTVASQTTSRRRRTTTTRVATTAPATTTVVSSSTSSSIVSTTTTTMPSTTTTTEPHSSTTSTTDPTTTTIDDSTTTTTDDSTTTAPDDSTTTTDPNAATTDPNATTTNPDDSTTTTDP